MSNDTSYDKIKHLVEIEDDIFAVFTINSSRDKQIMKKSSRINIMRELKKRRFIQKKAGNKGRKILGKSLQGYLPICELEY